MNFGNIWPFFLLLLIPIIILLYLLRQKTRDEPFSSLYLWREAYRNLEAARPWEKFRNNILMYLQIATVLALILALAAPYLKTGGVRRDNVILVIDTSASMNMQFDDKNTRLEQAKKRAEEYIDGLAEGTAVTMLTSDAVTTIRGTNITDKIEMKRVLTEIVSQHLPGNIQDAAPYAASIASGWEDYEMVFFTDSPVNLGELKGRVVSVNSKVENACIDYVSISQTEEEMTVLVKVTNTSPGSFASDINLYIDDSLKDISRVELGPLETTVLYFEGLAPEGELIWAQINEKDGMAQDNVSYAIREKQQLQTALIVTGRNTFLETAAGLVEGVEFYKTNQAEGTWEETFDLYIFDSLLPEKLPEKGNLIFINPPESIPGMAEVVGELQNVMISAQTHEVTRFLEEVSFGTVRATAFQRISGQDSFLKAGEESVGICGEYSGRRIAVLGFDLHDTDFPLQTEFPILIHNLVSYCLNQGLTRQSLFGTGDILTIYPEPEGKEIRVTGPDKEEQSLASDQRFTYQVSLPLSGIYTVSQRVEDIEQKEQIAVRFPTGQESYVTEWEETEGETANLQGERSVGRDLRNLFLLLTVILLCTEWWVYTKNR